MPKSEQRGGRFDYSRLIAELDKFAERDKLRQPQPPQPSGDYEPDEPGVADEFFKQLAALGEPKEPPLDEAEYQKWRTERGEPDDENSRFWYRLYLL